MDFDRSLKRTSNSIRSAKWSGLSDLLKQSIFDSVGNNIYPVRDLVGFPQTGTSQVLKATSFFFFPLFFFSSNLINRHIWSGSTRKDEMTPLTDLG